MGKDFGDTLEEGKNTKELENQLADLKIKEKWYILGS